ncbi:hypothetical protein SD37_16875 [Amycolatopsis orientalis]|uniref:DUF4346 domain-containing protein n=1 Tax=Amycolatopsis orientalis TaxID=31958 RepID=A0A193BY41_AMYOR|nr:hypothetical protein [Amycolatopsis orientalis]ANN17151.1 hypothetical protein SD37_16875 [Amycolatopsis orientalis]
MVTADVAVCTLGTPALSARVSAHPRVAVAAGLATANLGIETLVLGALARPSVRHVVVCGRDSRLFHPGQSLLSLAANGVADDGTIIGAAGHRPRLRTLRPAVVAEFRRRIAVHDLRECENEREVLTTVAALPIMKEFPRMSELRRPEAAETGIDDISSIAAEMACSGPVLERLPVQGKRSPIASGGNGYFVVSLDRPARRIVLRHYRPDLTTGHELRHHSAAALMTSVVSHGLISDPAHAGYLGGELAKAETALRLDLGYAQDRPLAGPVVALRGGNHDG